MSEEIENTDPLENFSFFDVLEGTSYPKDEVTVSLNESAGYQAQKLMAEAAEMEDPTPEKLEDLRKRLDKFRKEIEDSRVTFKLTGVSSEMISSSKDIVDEQFVDKKKTIAGANGRPIKYLPEEHALDYQRMLNAVVMSMHIEQVTYQKNGFSKIGLTPDEVAAFYDKAPTAAKARLSAAITGLQVDSDSFEAELDEGFFPKS